MDQTFTLKMIVKRCPKKESRLLASFLDLETNDMAEHKREGLWDPQRTMVLKGSNSPTRK